MSLALIAQSYSPWESSTFEGDEGIQLPPDKDEMVDKNRRLKQNHPRKASGRVRRRRRKNAHRRKKSFKNRRKSSHIHPPLEDQAVHGSSNATAHQKEEITAPLKKPQKLFKCPFCFIILAKAEELIQHLTIHDNEDQHPRQDVIVESSKRFQKEELIIPSQLPSCRVVLFRCDQLISAPEPNESATNSMPHQCSICSKVLASKTHLKWHMNTHTGLRPYKCAICKKGFAQPSTLLAHKLIHTGEKPHKCPTCLKAFNQASSLKTHMRVHNGEKPYTCPDCGDAFTQILSLKNHFRIHTGEKPYKCPTCLKTFTQTSSLKTHMRLHTGEKPYKCPVCGDAFTQNGSLKNHFRIHTGEKPYKCDGCGREFSTSGHRTS